MPQHTLLERIRGPFGDIFAGGSDPRLSSEQNAQARNQAIIQAGLATIIGASQPGATALASIAQGAGAGRQAGVGLRDRRVQQQGQQEIGDLLSQGGVDLPQMRQALIRAISTGDIETAKVLTATITSMQASQRAPAPVNFQTKEVFNEKTGVTELRSFNPRTAEIGNESLGQVAPTTIYESEFEEPSEDSPTGAFRIGIRRDTGAREILGLAVPKGGGEGGAQGKVERNLAQAMLQADRALVDHEPELARPIVGAIANIAQSPGITGFLGKAALAFFPEAQLAANAREQWVAPAVRLMSGAQMTQQERQTYRVAYTVQPHDLPAVQKQKAIARGTLATLFADDPDGLENLTTEQSRKILNSVLEASGLDPLTPSEEGGGLDENSFADLVPPKVIG